MVDPGRALSVEWLGTGQSVPGPVPSRFKAQGFTLPDTLPREWVAQCENVGRGDQALTYLARYLYRGVLREQNILAYDGERVSLQY